ncbi:unnamed protein product [Lampetra planeri]
MRVEAEAASPEVVDDDAETRDSGRRLLLLLVIMSAALLSEVVSALATHRSHIYLATHSNPTHPTHPRAVAPLCHPSEALSPAVAWPRQRRRAPLLRRLNNSASGPRGGDGRTRPIL